MNGGPLCSRRVSERPQPWAQRQAPPWSGILSFELSGQGGPRHSKTCISVATLQIGASPPALVSQPGRSVIGASLAQCSPLRSPDFQREGSNGRLCCLPPMREAALRPHLYWPHCHVDRRSCASCAGSARSTCIVRTRKGRTVGGYTQDFCFIRVRPHRDTLPVCCLVFAHVPIHFLALNQSSRHSIPSSSFLSCF